MPQDDVGCCQLSGMKYFDIGKGTFDLLANPRIKGIVLNCADQRRGPQGNWDYSSPYLCR